MTAAPRLSARDRQVGLLVACGHTGDEIAAKLGLAPRTVDTIKAKPEVRAFIQQKEDEGVTPRERLHALMMSSNDAVAIKAAEALARLGDASASPGTPRGATIRLVLPEGCEMGPGGVIDPEGKPVYQASRDGHVTRRLLVSEIETD